MKTDYQLLLDAVYLYVRTAQYPDPKVIIALTEPYISENAWEHFNEPAPPAVMTEAKLPEPVMNFGDFFKDKP
jgi:hypothetical protein